jgi:Right handed beta helix region
MNKFRFTIQMLAIAIFMFAFASMAQAQATRTWVSGVGDDANPCSRTAPCKTFAGAISKTAPNGEINVLDPGGFGAVTITKPMTIQGSGGSIAGVLVSGTNGIIIAAGNSDDVTLRDLDMNGLTTGLIGVKILSGRKITVERCQIYGFQGTGGTNGRAISDERTNASPIPQLFVNDCYLRNNVGGVGISGVGATVRAVIDNTRILGNSSAGVFVSNSNIATVTHSNISGNLGDGIQTQSNAQMNVISTTLHGNQGVGCNNNGGAHFSLADTTIVNNITGVSGTMTSFGNNNVRDNGGGNGLPPAVGQQ